MSSCDQVHAWLDGTLAPNERTAFEAHLEGCAKCSALVRSWQQFSTSYQASTQRLQNPPSEADTARLMQKVGRRRGSRGWLVGGIAVAAAATVLVLMAPWRRAEPPLQAFAVAADGTQTPLIGTAIDTASVLELGGDRIGVDGHTQVTLAHADRKLVKLELKTGSVAAKVSHRAPGQAFVVSSGGYDVVVVGTQFRVAHLERGVRVDVIEGHVKVKARQRQWDVLAGESLELGDEGREVRSPFTAEAFAELSTSPPPPPVPVVEPVDAGVAEAPEPKPVAPIPAAQVAKWRKAVVAGECPTVLPALRQRAREHSEQSEVWRVFADCLRLAGNDREAANAYQHVVATAPPEEADRARLFLATLLQGSLHEHAEAEKVLRAYLKHKQPAALEAAARVKLARSLIALGKKAEAKVELERVLRDLPESPPALEALELRKTLSP
jgi:ferric-dicitrate binding protein FerR (iron transport regulator)